ncbi:MAG: hypothetical protein JF606_23280 [Burkholderiales bacterium]|nr:hypothetical protein [Burkholderiales bacterium]
MKTQAWTEHATPLQQITIRLQGTRQSERRDIVNQLQTDRARLAAGDQAGESSDDDFGYLFVVNGASPGPSFFNQPASSW